MIGGEELKHDDGPKKIDNLKHRDEPKLYKENKKNERTQKYIKHPKTAIPNMSSATPGQDQTCFYISKVYKLIQV